MINNRDDVMNCSICNLIEVLLMFLQDFGLDEEKKTMELQENSLEYLTTNIKNNLDLSDISEINEAYQCTSKLDCYQ